MSANNWKTARKFVLSILCCPFMLLDSHTLGEKGVKIVVAVPKVEIVQLIFGLRLRLRTNLKLESVGQMGF